MVEIPGLAVGLLALLGVLTALGLIAVTRAFLHPLLTGLAFALRRVPGIGGYLSRAVLGFERTVLNSLARAALHAERFAAGWFRGLQRLVDRLGEQLEGLALDAFHAVTGLVRATIPRLLRALESRLLRLIRSVAARVVQAERFVQRELARLGHEVSTAATRLERQIVALGRRVEALVVTEVRDAVRLLRSGLGLAERAIRAAEFRIGRAEAQLFNIVGPELRRLAAELNPATVGEWAARHLWGLVPHELQLFLRWLWHLASGFAGFLVDVAEGRWPPPIDHHQGRRYVEQAARDAEQLADSLRRVLGL